MIVMFRNSLSQILRQVDWQSMSTVAMMLESTRGGDELGMVSWDMVSGNYSPNLITSIDEVRQFAIE